MELEWGAISLLTTPYICTKEEVPAHETEEILASTERLAQT